MGRLFGTDGIRGPANRYPITAEMAFRIGRAAARFFLRREHRPHRIVLGRDTRESGEMLENALVEGICSAGMDALLAGIIPTPAVAFLTADEQADCGIVVSASHNPYQDNGIKIFSAEGTKLPDKAEEIIEGLILDNHDNDADPSPACHGMARSLADARERYAAFVRGTVPGLFLKGLRIVLDCSHGATYRVAPAVFEALGAQVTVLSARPDGRNINDGCGSQHPGLLAERIVKDGADAGFAFDGDGDRVIAVDETGRVLTGDALLAICGRRLRDEGRLANNLVVRTVMSNIGLTIAFREMGIDSIMTDVGDRHVFAAMKERGAVLGGEDSGHLIFLDHHTSGDGILTALQVLAAKDAAGRPLSELGRLMTVYPQVLLNVETRSRPDLETVPAIREAIREAEASLDGRGRVLVRYSGTQNLCRVMVEGPTREETEAHADRIARIVQEILG
ncbi:MAG: phosphoglucosamine mutase [Syntrophaceae bacterium]|nr:phosphoglucosamine mutase [Syntrophaceae bacterium]